MADLLIFPTRGPQGIPGTSAAFTVSSQSAQLLLNAAIGEICVRTDINTSYVLQSLPASTFGNWQEILSPGGGGGGNPSGPTGSLQYNSSGSFGGSSITTDGTNLKLNSKQLQLGTGSYIVDDADGGINLVDQGGNILNWNQWDNNGLQLNGALLVMNNGTGTGGNIVYLDSAQIKFDDVAYQNADGSGNITLNAASLTVNNSISLANHKLTGLSNGTLSTDAAAFGQIPTALPPSGTAGGDLSSTYPNPTVSKVHGVSYPATPSTNTVPIVTSSNTITYEAVPNAALANSSLTVTASTGLTGGGSVALGSSVSLSLSTPVALANGGTHADLSATGGTGQYVKQSTGGGNLSVGTISSSDIPTLNQNTTGSAGSLSTTLIAGQGGTGLATLTAHGVLLGEGTSNVGFATIGTAGKVLTDNGSGVDPSFKTPLQKLSFTFDGGGSAITGTPFAWSMVQIAGTIVGYYLVADQSASVVMTVKKVAFGSYTGSSSFSSIVGAGTAPTLSSAVSSSDTTLTSWTTSVAANDIIQVAISSVSTATHIQIFFMINGS